MKRLLLALSLLPLLATAGIDRSMDTQTQPVPTAPSPQTPEAPVEQPRHYPQAEQAIKTKHKVAPLKVAENIKQFKKKHKRKRRKANGEGFFILALTIGTIAFFVGGIGGLILIFSAINPIAGTTALIGALLTGLLTYVVVLSVLLGGMSNGAGDDMGAYTFAALLIIALSAFSILAAFQVGWFASVLASQIMISLGIALILGAIVLGITS